MNRIARVVGFVLLGLSATIVRGQDDTRASVRWRKTVIDAAFRSEGVAVADVNRDGKTDILVGDYWYQAPNWQRQAIRPPRTDLGDGASTYSDAFCCWTGDFNRDGWPDLLVVGFPGKPVFWYENPGNRAIDSRNPHWAAHKVVDSACNETPIYTSLFGDGKKQLVLATQPEGQMCWLAPGTAPTQPWERHAVSVASRPGATVPGTDVFSHGLGAGDVNGDKRMDILVKQGWWEQPKRAKESAAAWTFHAADLGEDCANLHTLDLNGGRKADVVSSSAHGRGVWWFERQGDGFVRHTISEAFTQSHALNVADINGDKQPDLITGKRRWAHGPGGDVDPGAAPVLYWFTFERQKNQPPRFIPHVVDDDSGIGTQFVTEDVNGDKRTDIVVSNKRGVFLFTQER